MSITGQHSMRLPRHGGKVETYLARFEKLKFRDFSGEVVQAIVHVISREEIESGNVLSLSNSFHPKRPRKDLRNNAGRCIFSVQGYGEQADELYAIPQVREYFQFATKTWPHWLFSSCVFFPSAVVVALCCLKNLQVSQAADHVVVSFDISEMEAFFDKCLDATAILDARAGITREETIQRLSHFRKCVGIQD